MSSEIPLPSPKKSKPHSEHKSKKRAREGTHDHAPQAEDEGPAKKQKKSKRDKVSNGTPAKTADQEAELATIAKKHKKAKKQRVESNVENGTEPINPQPSRHLASTDGGGHQANVDDKYLEKGSPFVQETSSLFLAMSPVAHKFPLEGACAEHISPLLLTYYPPLGGILLSYSNARLSEQPEQGAHAISDSKADKVLGKCIDEYAVTYVWLTAEFLLFRPRSGTVIEGHVSLQNESILGLLCYNYFNAGIERSRLPKDWQWIEEEEPKPTDEKQRHRHRGTAGHYVDGQGNSIEGRLVLRVKDFEATVGADSGTGSINIYGTLLPEAEDAKVDDELRHKSLVKVVSSRKQ